VEYAGDRHRLAACQLHLEGIVQGVGFRPYVYRLALALCLQGWVLNSTSGLDVWVEGQPAAVAEFCREIREQPPRLARIISCTVTPAEPLGYRDFEIRHSDERGAKVALIAPDVASCEDCQREILDPADRRYRYPFTNCTNCGPRYTIVQDLPYDRENTTMRVFPMCPQCRMEYEDPGHRRFHAQPNACPVCGPRLELATARGEAVNGDPIAESGRLLQAGWILAIKGLGGFHLACNAEDPGAVEQLRRRKQREHKPFAVMARDLATVERFCQVSAAERNALSSPAAPIVLLARRPEAETDLPIAELCPGVKSLGVMLPYTPLHHLLCWEGPPLLVMTSANISDDPLVTDNQEARQRLEGIADYFLLHDRDIFSRCDDSVLRVDSGRNHFLRRARGYVPLPIELPWSGPVVLACGGEMKNTICLTRRREAYLSQHVGDLNHFGNYQQFLQTVPHMQRLLQVEPEIVAFDLHPGYAASQYGRSRSDLIQVAVQHHHAHMASCMAEHGLSGPVVGVICDGTGFGTDSTIWGFEFLIGGYNGFRRAGHLTPFPLPGGEASIRRPERMAATFLSLAVGADVASPAGLGLSAEEQQLLRQMIAQNLNCPLTSSCGRLFDGVSAFLGICREPGYEGQAAIELESYALAAWPGALPPLARDLAEAWQMEGAGYQFSPAARTDGVWELGWQDLWRDLTTDWARGTRREEIALRFHLSIARGIMETVLRLREQTGINQICLSGGSFHNQILSGAVRWLLEQEGCLVYSHHAVPTNDGGLALGQAAVALCAVAEGK